MQRLFIHRIHLRLQQLGLFLPIGSKKFLSLILTANQDAPTAVCVRAWLRRSARRACSSRRSSRCAMPYPNASILALSSAGSTGLVT